MESTVKEDLISELKLLQEEYIKLLNDVDVLENWGKPQLEAIYATRIGQYKLRVLEAQIRIKGHKLKIEMIRAAIAQHKKIDLDQIELTIAEKLAVAYEQVMEQSMQIELSKNMLRNLETPERSAELRKIFRQLAKDLHPDVHPDLTYEQTQIWHLVKDAYEKGDVQKLKALQVVYQDEIKNIQRKIEDISESDITLQHQTIKAGIKVLHKQISELKSQFPFTLENELKNEDWIVEQVKDIETEQVKLETYERELLTEIQSLLA